MNDAITKKRPPISLVQSLRGNSSNQFKCRSYRSVIGGSHLKRFNQFLIVVICAALIVSAILIPPLLFPPDDAETEEVSNVDVWFESPMVRLSRTAVSNNLTTYDIYAAKGE